MRPLRFVYFGTPNFARIILDELEKNNLLPAAVVCAPAKPKGRHLVLTPSEVEIWAKKRNIPTLTPEKIRGNTTFTDELRKIDAELFVVAAYGKILPKEIIEMPAHGTLNVHPSLLPKFRGASPIESVILSDETRTGVTIMLLDEELDHGPIIRQEQVEIPEWPPRGSVLTELLAHKGGILLRDSINDWINGSISPKEQDHNMATFTKKIEKEDAEVFPEKDPYGSYKKIRAFDVWPIAWATIQRHGKPLRIKITDAVYRDGKLTLLRVIPEGKKEMSYDDLLRGF